MPRSVNERSRTSSGRPGALVATARFPRRVGSSNRVLAVTLRRGLLFTCAVTLPGSAETRAAERAPPSSGSNSAGSSTGAWTTSNAATFAVSTRTERERRADSTIASPLTSCQKSSVGSLPLGASEDDPKGAVIDERPVAHGQARAWHGRAETRVPWQASAQRREQHHDEKCVERAHGRGRWTSHQDEGFTYQIDRSLRHRPRPTRRREGKRGAARLPAHGVGEHA